MQHRIMFAEFRDQGCTLVGDSGLFPNPFLFLVRRRELLATDSCEDQMGYVCSLVAFRVVSYWQQTYDST